MERLKLLIQHTGLSQKDFAERIGLSGNAITELLKGRSKGLSEKSLSAIAKEFNVNLNWLLTGEGEMFILNPTVVVEKESGELEGIKGGAEEVDVDIDHVKWFRKLSRKKQTAILAIAEIEDDEYIDEVKGSTLFKLRQQRDVEKAAEETRGAIRKKGEAG